MDYIHNSFIDTKEKKMNNLGVAMALIMLGINTCILVMEAFDGFDKNLKTMIVRAQLLLWIVIAVVLGT